MTTEMTTYGIVMILLFVLITLIILAISFWGKGSAKFTRLQDVYRDKYLDEAETLDDDLKRGKIDEATYEATKAELAHDLLAVAHKDRSLSNGTKAISVMFGSAIVLFSGAYFWLDGYSEDAKNLDAQRYIAKPYVENWLASITVEDLQRAQNLMDLNPPEPLQNNLLGTLATLNMMSARDHHTDPKELNLLGKVYLNLDQLDLAERTYLDLYRLDPNNTNTYYTLLNVQLAKNEYKLDQRLEALFDQFVMKNPENEGLLLYYATVLFENQKMDKALHYFSILADLYPEGSENRKVITNMVAGLAAQQNMNVDQNAGNVTNNDTNSNDVDQEAVTTSNAGIPVTVNLAGVDLRSLPQEAILFIFVRNAEVGPPLAAKRIPIAGIEGFPLSIALTDADLLMPGSASLTDSDNLSISAKISLNGDPITKSGDIEAADVQIVGTEEGNINILLNKVVE